MVLLYVRDAQERASRRLARGEKAAGRRSDSPLQKVSTFDTLMPSGPKQGEKMKLRLPEITRDFSRLDIHVFVAKLGRCNSGVELYREMVDNAMER